MQARLNMERQMDYIQSAHVRQGNQPYSKDELYNQFGSQTVEGLQKHYQRAIDDATATSSDWNGKMKIMESRYNGKPMTPEDAASYQELLNNKSSWDDIVDSYHSEFSKTMGWVRPIGDKPGYIDRNSQAYKSFVKNIQQDPVDYIADIQKGVMADNWANRTAGISKVDYKENTAYVAAQSHLDRVAELLEKRWNDGMKGTIDEQKVTLKEMEDYHKMGILPPGVSGNNSGISSLSWNTAQGNRNGFDNLMSGDINFDPT
jgi:hypothetical protein